jgi:hypothetical protein
MATHIHSNPPPVFDEFNARLIIHVVRKLVSEALSGKYVVDEDKGTELEGNTPQVISFP